MNKEQVKYFYKNGFWTISIVKMAVKKGVISKKNYKEITGEEYK